MKVIFILLGFIFAGIGLVGVYLPLLPTTPFLILAAACFARGSRRFHTWLTGLAIYQNNVEPILQGKGMTKEKKYKVLGLISLLFLVSLILIPIQHARIAILVLLAIHYYIFLKRIPTQDPDCLNE